MTTATLRLFASLVVLLLVGCSDYSLRLVSGGGAITAPNLGTSPLDPPAPPIEPPQGPNSPWDSLDPGNFPEDLFAVAWNDPREACLDCSSFERYERPRYDILDAQGRVLVRFDLPWQDPQVGHNSLHPAGPGRFLVDSFVYGGSDPRYRKVWFGDGLSGEVDVVLEFGSEPDVYLPQADRLIALPEGFRAAHVRPDPQDPDRIYLLVRVVSLSEEVLQARLYSLHVRDPQEPVFTWHPEDMLAPAFHPQPGEAPLYPWFFETFQDGEESTVVLGVVAMDSGDYPSTLVSFSPDHGPGDWSLDVTGRVLLDVSPSSALGGPHLTVRPPLGTEPGQALLYEDLSTFGTCYGPGFRTWDGEEWVALESSEDFECMQIGAQIEPSTSTFLYFGQEDAPDVPGQDRLVLSHRGQDVWDYTVFEDGLAQLPFDIRQMVRLDLPESP